MKIVFFSDVHGNQYSFRSLLHRLESLKPDLVVFGGDVFGYYYGQKEILSTLESKNYICLLGNHDKYFLDLCDNMQSLDYLVNKYGNTYKFSIETITSSELIFLKKFKLRFDLEIDNLKLSFVHGSILDALEGRIYPDALIDNIKVYDRLDYVFMGHTHHKMVKKISDKTTLLNPGSIGQQRDGKGCSFLVFDTITQEYTFEEVFYDKDLLVREILSKNETEDMESKLIEVLYRK